MDNAHPYESPSTPPTRAGDQPKLGRWRSALSGVLVFIGVCFLPLLNGQVFTNTVVFLGFCTISLFIWIPVVFQSSQNQDRRITFYDNVVEDDLKRQWHLESLGWKVIRFSDKDVEVDAEAVARAIARVLNLEYAFRPRKATGSGMRHINAKPKRRMSHNNFTRPPEVVQFWNHLDITT